MYRHDLIDQMQVGDREDYNDRHTEEISNREQVEVQVYNIILFKLTCLEDNLSSLCYGPTTLAAFLYAEILFVSYLLYVSVILLLQDSATITMEPAEEDASSVEEEVEDLSEVEKEVSNKMS